MGKQKKRNAFSYYMSIKKPEVERQLKRKVSMSEMVQLVSAEWQALSNEERKKYQLMSGENRETLDCRGVPLRHLKEAAEERRHQAERMKRDIADLVDMYQMGGAIHKACFFVVSTSYYADTGCDQYVPAELSLLRFSLKDGIMVEFHGIVAPVIPRSFAASAMKHSQDTHKLPIDSEVFGNSLKETGDNLKLFLSKTWDKDVPVYTLHDNMEEAQQILKTVTGNKFKVYSLDLLYQLLYSTAVHNIPLSVATDMITECGLDYFPNIACTSHNTELKDGARFCTLSCVRRWVYFMCKNLDLKNLFGVEPQMGKHYPAQEEQPDVSRGLSSLTLEDFASDWGAAGHDPWIPLDGHGKTLTARPWEVEDFPPLDSKQPKKKSAVVGRQEGILGKRHARQALEMD